MAKGFAVLDAWWIPCARHLQESNTVEGLGSMYLGIVKFFSNYNDIEMYRMLVINTSASEEQDIELILEQGMSVGANNSTHIEPLLTSAEDHPADKKLDVMNIFFGKKA